jgi:hypothetical protein
MFLIYGRRSYGKVSHVPGLFYVVTQFVHLYYLPLVPYQSYLVIDGSEQGDEFQGVRIRFDWSSILATYLRTGLGFFAVVGASLLGQNLGEYYSSPDRKMAHSESTVGMIAALAVVALLLLIFFSRGWMFLVSQSILVILSAIFIADLTFRPPANSADGNASVKLIIFTNILVALHGLTRLFLRVSYRKALYLGALAGIPADRVAAYFVAGSTGRHKPDVSANLPNFDASSYFVPTQPGVSHERDPADPHADRVRGG